MLTFSQSGSREVLNFILNCLPHALHLHPAVQLHRDESCSSKCMCVPVDDLYLHNILLGYAHEQKALGGTVKHIEASLSTISRCRCLSIFKSLGGVKSSFLMIEINN
jgi:hypothetical protein